MNHELTQQSKKKRNQLITVFLLTIGLLVALMTQPDKIGSTHPEAKNHSSDLAITPVALQSVDGMPDSTSGAEVFKTVDLPRLSLDVTRRIDLFSSAPSVSRREKNHPINVRSVVVNAIYGDHSGSHLPAQNQSVQNHSALIGQAIIRPGHDLEAGLQVANVSPEGITIVSRNPSNAQ